MLSLGDALLAVRGHPSLGKLRRGVEKESLRITPDGALAVTPHPRSLGSPLTHPHITTDFSESQLELVTGVHDSPEAMLAELTDIHDHVYANVGNQLLWGASMPCRLPADALIPIARYGTSNAGRFKAIYREGLSRRYGRSMQTISGIHYNFSVPDQLLAEIAASRDRPFDTDFVTEAYFALIRNFRRFCWLLVYLFGASPAVSRSFANAENAGLEVWDDDTLYHPYGTSLRMGPLGYRSEAQTSLDISYDSLPRYVATMRGALTRPYPAFEAIGVVVDGVYRQLCASLLQVEAEYYNGAIRPKRPAADGERALDALARRGIEYVEVRCMDLDPFCALGIDSRTCRFLDTFLLFCMLEPSPADDLEQAAQQANLASVVKRGRAPAIELHSATGPRGLASWADELLDSCAAVAAELDAVLGNDGYSQAVEAQRRKVADPAKTPSGRLLASLAERRIPFVEFGLECAQDAGSWFRARTMPVERGRALQAISRASIVDQARVEAEDTEPFDTWLARYLRFDDAASEASPRGDGASS